VAAGAGPAPAGLLAQGGAKVDFRTQIRPIFEARCYECHGPDEQEAELRFDLKSSVFHEGGVDEWTIVPGKAEESEVYARIILPYEDPDVMPNEGDVLTKEQIALIRDWINQGAEWPDDGAAAAKPARPEAKAIALPALSDAQAAARKAAMAAVTERGALALPVAADTLAVDVNFSLVGGDVTDVDLALLDGLETTLVWLNLSRTGVTDEGIARLAGFPQLRRVNLSRTAVGDAALRHLAGLEHLEYLNLYGTAVTDAGLEHLRGLAELRKLYLWQSEVTEAGAQKLREALPNVAIDLGDYAEEILEVARARTPVNAKCPLTDKPVKPAYVFSFEGRTIGFCCEKCLAKFAADPAQFKDKIVEGEGEKPEEKADEKPGKKPEKKAEQKNRKKAG
jgi:mono/diheme cytochrome c family protein/YHS domain-containing protein